MEKRVATPDEFARVPLRGSVRDIKRNKSEQKRLVSRVLFTRPDDIFEDPERMVAGPEIREK